jgi:hypothetical protein
MRYILFFFLPSAQQQNNTRRSKSNAWPQTIDLKDGSFTLTKKF